jgi:hypothetical protein
LFLGSFERINEWNSRNAFNGTPGYIDKTGLAHVGSGHSMMAGTNQKLIAQWLKDFEVTVGEFERFTR